MAPAEYRKAIVGAIVGAATAAGTALADGEITTAEWLGILVAAVATFGGVYQVPNAAHHDVAGKHQAGASDPLYVLVLVFVALLVVALFIWVFPNNH